MKLRAVLTARVSSTMCVRSTARLVTAQDVEQDIDLVVRPVQTDDSHPFGSHH